MRKEEFLVGIARILEVPDESVGENSALSEFEEWNSLTEDRLDSFRRREARGSPGFQVHSVRQDDRGPAGDGKNES